VFYSQIQDAVYIRKKTY